MNTQQNTHQTAAEAADKTITDLRYQVERQQKTIQRFEAQRDALLEALKAVAGDSIAMRGFHEQFRNEIRAAIAIVEANQ